MAILDKLAKLTRTDLLLMVVLVLSISASALISTANYHSQSVFYALPVKSNATLSNNQVSVIDVSNIAYEILPSLELESRPHPSALPDFSAIEDVTTKKQTFFKYMLPKVRKANDKIRANRRLLLMIHDDLTKGEVLNEDDIQLVSKLKTRYKINQRATLRSAIDDLLIRMDVVPESLVLAQAANESGWGTSRFARQANNLFGIWCFREGCGLTPKDRDEGLNHEVAKYETVQAGIVAYIHTINTNPAYIRLRNIRATKRSQELHFSGLELAEGLLKYSSRGIEYVRDIQQMIRVNELQKYTLPLQA
jgi:Bax protein